MKKFLGYDTFYEWLFDWHVPIIFVLFIGSLVLTGINQNSLYCVIGWSIAFVFSIFSMCYLYDSANHIKFWWKSLFKYKLSKEEIPIWESIVNKEYEGYKEWLEQTKGDDLCGHWVKDITPEEVALLDKIHQKYYGKDWYVIMPLSTAQVCAVEYDDVKDKIKY